MDGKTQKRFINITAFGCFSHQTSQTKHTKEEQHGWTDGWMNGGQGLQVTHGAVNPTLPLFKTSLEAAKGTNREQMECLSLLHHTSPLASPARPMSGNCQQWINNPDINTLSLNEQQFLWDVKPHRVAGSFRSTAGCGLRPSARMESRHQTNTPLVTVYLSWAWKTRTEKA